MYILPAHRDKSALHYAVEEPCSRTVIKMLGRLGALHLDDDAGYRVPLIRSNFRLVGVECKSHLVILDHRPLEHRAINIFSDLLTAVDQFVNVRPTVRVKFDPDRLRLVPQHQRQKFTHILDRHD